MITDEEIEDVAKEICYQLNIDHECNNDCDSCKGFSTWRRYKIAAKRLIKKIKGG